MQERQEKLRGDRTRRFRWTALGYFFLIKHKCGQFRRNFGIILGYIFIIVEICNLEAN